MVKHTQTIHRTLSVIDHFVGLALKGLSLIGKINWYLKGTISEQGVSL